MMMAAPRRRSTGWIIACVILAGLLALSLLGNVRHWLGGFLGGKGGAPRMGGPRLEEVTVEYHHAANKIAIIPVEGIITSRNFGRSSYNMVYFVQDQLRKAGLDEDVRAVVLKVNSPGGEVLAADEIFRAIEQFEKDYHKPVVASMGSVAASGGYYISAPCRWIVANELTITGSIGVIMHSYNYRGLMKKVGLQPEVFKSGAYKDMLSGEQDLENLTPDQQARREEEEKMVQDLIDETFGRFKEVVRTGRQQASQLNNGKGHSLIDGWTDVADGRIFSGKKALEYGFVDELGNLDTAINRAKALAHITEANLIEYQQVIDFSNFFRIFGEAESKSVKLDLGLDVPRLEAGRLYFLPAVFLH